MTIQGVAYHAWAVFTSLPAGETENGGKAYLEHLIGYEGSYLTYVASQFTGGTGHGEIMPRWNWPCLILKA